MVKSATQHRDLEQDPRAGTTPAPAARPGIEYHRVLAGEQRRIGRGILAIVLLVGGLWAAILSLSALATVIDQVLGIPKEAEGRGPLTPTLHAFGMLGNAVLIPWSMVIMRWLYGVPIASLHSVFSRFRFELFARALLIIVPTFVVLNLLSGYLQPGGSALWRQSDLLWMLAATLLLVPLQATGEEYGFRGLVFRVASSWGRGPRTSLVLGIAVTVPVFASIHIASDPWLFLWYFVFATTTCLITWRSGGIEIAIVLHAAFNTLSFVFAVGTSGDISGAGDRSGGDVSAAFQVVAASLVMIAATLVVWFRTRHTGPVTTPPADWRPHDWQRLNGLADRPVPSAGSTR